MQTDIVSIENFHLTPEQQKAVEFLAEFSEQMVAMALQGNNTLTDVVSLVREIYRVCDDVIAGCLRNGSKLPCKKGCVWCCYLRVKVTPLEVICIIDDLQSNLKVSELSALRQRIIETDEMTRGVDGIGRVRLKRICPLIVEGKCLAYRIRPITCRMYHSLDASECELSLNDDRQSLRIRHDITGIGMGMFVGMTEGLRTVGLQSGVLELITGLRIAMEEPKLMKRWLAGVPAFAEAEMESEKEIEGFYHSKKLGNPP
jgi:hypothetical protein